MEKKYSSQSGQALIESCITILITISAIKFLLFTGYSLYTSVLTEYIVYEMSICRTKILNYQQCLNSYEKRIKHLLPLGKLHTFMTHTGNNGKEIYSHLQFNIEIPFLNSPITFNKKSFLKFPLLPNNGRL